MSVSVSAPPSAAAFYCVADSRYAIGAAALVNSLRLQGHSEPIHLLDCGLTSAERRRFEPHATIVDAPRQSPPHLLKTVAPLAHPARVMVLIDTDMIVTRSLGGLIARAAEGAIVAFENDRPRHVPEWGELLDLGAMRPGPYVSVGLVLAGGAPGAEAIGLMDDRQRLVDFERGFLGARDPDYPFLYPEQDVLNAILRTRIDPAALVALDRRLAATPPFRGLRIGDLATCRCAYRDGTEPYVLHHFHRKPWLTPMRHGVFSRLLSRLLLADDVAVRVPREEIPLRLRDGLAARIERARVDAIDVSRRYMRDPLAARLGARARRDREAAS